MFSPILRVVAVLALVAVLAGIGIGVYNAGVNEGIAQAAIAAQAAGEARPPVSAIRLRLRLGPLGRRGSGIFGFLFLIFGFFLIIGLVRAAFGWGRWGGGGRGLVAGAGGREERIEEFHRELHRRDAESAGARSGAVRGPIAARRIAAMPTILVVDDEPKIVRLVRDYLTDAGFAVTTAVERAPRRSCAPGPSRRTSWSSTSACPGSTAST